MQSIVPISDFLFLSEFSAGDISPLVHYLNDPEIARNTLTIPFPYKESDAEWWLKKVEESTALYGKPNNWAIRHKEEGLIGGIGVFFLNGPEASYDEIGYWLAGPFRGQGYMTETVREFSAWQFRSRPNLLRLEAWVFSHNIASMKVLEKAGYNREGYVRKRTVKNGVPHDTVLFGKLRP